MAGQGRCVLIGKSVIRTKAHYIFTSRRVNRRMRRHVLPRRGVILVMIRHILPRYAFRRYALARSPDQIPVGITWVFFLLLHGCYEGFPL